VLVAADGIAGPVTRRDRTPGVLMSTVPSPAGKLYLVVGYDGSPPAVRALDAAARLLTGRDGRIEVVYVAHLTPAEMMSADAIAEMREVFDEVADDLRAQATEQLSGREERWRFERRRGPIHEELVAAAAKVPGAGPDDTAVIVVGSSSQAAHRMIGSVAVSLARHAPVPLVIVP
jgi:nucleotide-binding universal stress UspA family protein